jgi:TolA-binding protein
MTIKQYAKSRGVSYEATRKSIERHANELKDHITTEGRTRILDEEAVEILDRHRSKASTPAIEENTRDQFIHQLQMEIIQLQQTIIDLQGSYQQALIDSTTARTALESETRTTERLTGEIDRLHDELESYRPTIFGLYRKRSGMAKNG